MNDFAKIDLSLAEKKIWLDFLWLFISSIIFNWLNISLLKKTYWDKGPPHFSFSFSAVSFFKIRFLPQLEQAEKRERCKLASFTVLRQLCWTCKKLLKTDGCLLSSVTMIPISSISFIIPYQFCLGLYLV